MTDPMDARRARAAYAEVGNRKRSKGLGQTVKLSHGFVEHGVPSNVLVPSSILAPSSDARSP